MLGKVILGLGGLSVVSWLVSLILLQYLEDELTNRQEALNRDSGPLDVALILTEGVN